MTGVHPCTLMSVPVPVLVSKKNARCACEKQCSLIWKTCPEQHQQKEPAKWLSVSLWWDFSGVRCAWFHSLCCGEQFLQDWPQGCEAKLPGEYEDASWVPMRKNRWNHCISKSGSLTLVQSLKAKHHPKLSLGAFYTSVKEHQTRTSPRPVPRGEGDVKKPMHFLEFSPIVSFFGEFKAGTLSN